jgi:hypothetical protein
VTTPAHYEDWPALQAGADHGVTWDKAQELYGAPIRPDTDADHPIRQQGLAALRLLRASIRSRYRMSQADLLRRPTPALAALFGSDVILTRAVLIPVPDSSPKRFVPVAHIGPDGFVLLTHEQSQRSLAGQQDEPPGGFGAAGVFGTLDRGARNVNKVLSHPTTRAVAGVLTLGALVKTAFDLVR